MLQLWDMRALRCAGGVAAASAQPLRDVDWAAQTPHCLSTVGDDQRLRVWDLRQGPAQCPSFCAPAQRASSGRVSVLCDLRKVSGRPKARPRLLRTACVCAQACVAAEVSSAHERTAPSCCRLNPSPCVCTAAGPLLPMGGRIWWVRRAAATLLWGTLLFCLNRMLWRCIETYKPCAGVRRRGRC